MERARARYYNNMFESINAGRRIRWFILIRVLLVLLRKPRSTRAWFWGHNSFHSWVLADGGMCAANWFTKWWDTWIFPMPLEIVNSLSLRWIIGCVVWTWERPNPTRGCGISIEHSPFALKLTSPPTCERPFGRQRATSSPAQGNLSQTVETFSLALLHFNPAHHLSYYLIRTKANIPAQFIRRTILGAMTVFIADKDVLKCILRTS